MICKNTAKSWRTLISIASAVLCRKIVGRNGHDMSKSIRVAIIGCGLIGQKRLNNLPRGSVTAVCDLQLERAKKLAAQSPGCVATDSVEQVINSRNVDAVMIATLNSSLAPIALQALKAGKHVL